MSGGIVLLALTIAVCVVAPGVAYNVAAWRYHRAARTYHRAADAALAEANTYKASVDEYHAAVRAEEMARCKDCITRLCEERRAREAQEKGLLL